MKPKVLVDKHGNAHSDDIARLAAVAEVVEPEGQLTEEGLIAALQGCTGLIRLGGRIPDLTKAVFAGTPDLEIAGVRGDRFGTGIDLEAAWEHGVVAVDTDNIGSAPPVAEWDLALILLCLRNGAAVYRQMIAGDETWAVAGNEDYVNGELTGRKVGLIGCGHVGQRLIELLVPFDVDLKVYDPYLLEEIATRYGIVRGELDEVLTHADILVVQVPHTPKTEGMIGGRELDLLGKGRIIVNCSRGPVVDYEELTVRLTAGEFIAGLDVFDPEPLPRDSRLRNLPNVFVSPHIAWYAPESLHRYFATMVDDFIRFLNDEPLQFELTARIVDIRHGRT